MFESGAAITRTLHKVVLFYVKFTETVDYDMDVNIAAFIMTVCVSTDESLMPREISFGKRYAELLCALSRQTTF